MTDALGLIKTLLTNGWNDANTNSITPVIDFVEKYKQLDLRNKDYVLLHSLTDAHSPFNIGGTTFHNQKGAVIDIRTTYKNAVWADVRGHLIKIQEEVERIVKANIADPDGTHQLFQLASGRDRSDKNVGIGRYLINVTLKKWGS